MSIVVVNHVSLDGVMQGPGRPDEDTRGGFRQGGWAANSDDPLLGAAMGSVMGQGFSWLFGRRSYEGMLGHWNATGGPFKDGLNGPTKYVASTDPDTELPWPNSTLVSGDVPAAVTRLRTDASGNLVIMGSAQLIRSLLPHHLIDELLLMIHPVVLGSGLRLFGSDDELHRFELVTAETTDDGIIVARYRSQLG